MTRTEGTAVRDFLQSTSTPPEAALDCIVARLTAAGGMLEGLTLDYVILSRRSEDAWKVVGQRNVAGGEVAPLPESAGLASAECESASSAQAATARKTIASGRRL